MKRLTILAFLTAATLVGCGGDENTGTQLITTSIPDGGTPDLDPANTGSNQANAPTPTGTANVGAKAGPLHRKPTELQTGDVDNVTIR